MAEEKCGNCKYRKKEECRRYPPAFVSSTVAQLSRRQPTEGVFPTVDNKAWCGEWKAEE